MSFNFDKVIDRRNTHSSKWDALGVATGATADDAIAMWVADMDFQVPIEVTKALDEEIKRGMHGYYTNDITWRTTMSNWLNRHHNWQPDPNWIIPTPGIVSALGMILQAVSEKDDSVIVFSPAYHAFGKIIKANDRKLHNQPMINEQGRYKMDLEGLANNMPKNAKVVFFCSPHNPGGRVWSKEEIKELCDFCQTHDLILVSDEIHHDLVYSDAKHHVTYTTAPEIADRLITCVAASKTFNLAGAHVGGVIISNDTLREKFKKVAGQSGLLSYPLFGMIATEAAQTHGDAWLAALIPYLQANRDYLEEQMPKAVAGSRPMHLEATYLGWVDFSDCEHDRSEIMKRITKTARIGPSPGPQFGDGGENWIRFNFATPKSILVEAIERIGNAF